MVDFRLTMGGYEVFVNEQTFGHISKDRGFFTDPTVVKCFMEMSADDLQTIQEKVREVTRQEAARSTQPIDNDTRKARALMIIIHKMIAAYQSSHAGNLDEGIFKLFEKAKKIRDSHESCELTDAIKDI
jgi:hypothetical protein